MDVRSTSTPQALLQTDIIVLVMRECETSTLGRFARVSRLHSEYALDALWREINGYTILRLVKLVPETCFQPPVSSNNALTKSEWIIKGELQSADWERFKFYSSRVSTWIIEKERALKELRPAVYTLTASRHSAGPAPLFPRLRRLFLRDGTSTSMEMSRLGLSPSLVEFDCRSQAIMPPSKTWYTLFASYLSSMVEVVPDLTALVVAPGAREADALNLLLRKSRKLQRIRLDFTADFPVAQSIFEGVSLPYLEDIGLAWEALVPVSHVLEELRIISESLRRLPSVLRLLLTGRILHPVQVGYSDTHNILTLFSQAPQLYTLRASSLSSVLNLSHCRTLMLQTVAPLEISDYDLHVLTEAAPLLETLWLNPSPLGVTAEDVPSLTYHSLISITHNTRSLRILGLYLDMRQVPLSLPSEQVENPLLSLMRLNVGSSHLSLDSFDRYGAAAKFLHVVFPKLRGLRWSRDALVEWGEICPCCRFSTAWSDVDRLLKEEAEGIIGGTTVK